MPYTNVPAAAGITAIGPHKRPIGIAAAPVRFSIPARHITVISTDCLGLNIKYVNNKNKKNATAVTPASTEIISIWTITNIATKIEQASIGIITAIRVATTISAKLLGFILPDS